MTKTEKNELRVKVAELCGYERYLGAWVRKNTQDQDMPDYPNDLNACAKFENEVLKKNVRLYLAYARLLIEWLGAIDAIFAGPTVRCEAFVKTMEEKR